VTSDGPCSIAAKPPTMTNSTSASNRRWISRFRSFTQLLAGALELERQIQRLLVLHSALIVGETQALFYEREVETRSFSLFEGTRVSPHGGQHLMAL
jgi:hypothetical protein